MKGPRTLGSRPLGWTQQIRATAVVLTSEHGKRVVLEGRCDVDQSAVPAPRRGSPASANTRRAGVRGLSASERYPTLLVRTTLAGQVEATRFHALPCLRAGDVGREGLDRES